MTRRFLPHLGLMIVGYIIAVIVASLVLLVVISLPHYTKTTSGWSSFIWKDLVGGLPVLMLIVTLVAFPAWLVTAFICELTALRSKYFYALTGLATAFLAHFFFNGMDLSHIEAAFLVPSLISGVCGGLAYWAFIGKQAGAWLPQTGVVE
jgi:hypothetical protein